MLYKNYTDLVNKLVWIIPKKSKRDNIRNILNDIVNTAYKIEYLIKQIAICLISINCYLCSCIYFYSGFR